MTVSARKSPHAPFSKQAAAEITLLAIDPDAASRRLLLAMLSGCDADPFRAHCVGDCAEIADALDTGTFDAAFISLAQSNQSLEHSVETIRARAPGLAVIGYGSIDFGRDKTRVPALGMAGMIPPASLTAVKKVVAWMRQEACSASAFPFDARDHTDASSFRAAVPRPA